MVKETRSPQEAPSNLMRNYTLFILTLVYAFNFIDRQILVILQPLIKKELMLSDTQLGLLSGIVFAFFYTIIGIPIARYADRANRRNIIAASLAIWSAMTALSGFAANYMQLALARMGVGIGEAGGSPPAHSMISSMFKPQKRATALAIYSAGLYLGVLLGFSLGGYFGENFGWRATFLIVGLPGLLLALIFLFTVKEPARATQPPAELSNIKGTLAKIWALKSFPFIAFGCAMAAFISYGTSSFMPSFMVRYHQVPLSEIGFLLGLTSGGGGIIGSYLGGYLTDKFGAKDVRWYLWLPGIFGVSAIPFGIAVYHVESLDLMLGLYFCLVILGTSYLAPSIAVCHRLVGPHMRALSSALLFFVLNLIGLGGGPLFVGWLSDAMTASRGVESLHWALTIGVSIAFIKGYFFWIGGKNLPADIAKLSEDNS